MAIDLSPDAVGFAAGWGPKDKHLGDQIHPSHILTLLYTAMTNLGKAGNAFADASQTDSPVAWEYGALHFQMVASALADLIRADFKNACELVPAMSEEEFDIAFLEFLKSRREQFVDAETGTPIFEKLPEPVRFGDDPDDLDQFAKLS